MNYFGELSNNSPRRTVQCICSEGCPIKFYRELTNVFSKTKTFCFEDSVSHTWNMHARGIQGGLEMWERVSHILIHNM